jgi:hypothetical protein
MNMTADQMKAYFRKPELKITLPSQGAFYPPGTLQLDQTGEVDVYPMTAIDELTLKTPDALLTGEGTVKTIQQDHEIDLQSLFDRVNKEQVSNQLLLENGIKVVVRPNNYQQLSLIRRQTFEKQRLARTINDAKIDDKDKQEEFNKIFAELTKMNVESLVNNIEAIELPDGVIQSRDDINTFVNNVDLKFVNAVRAKVESMAKLGAVPPFTVESPEEDVEKGAPKTYNVPIMFDNSDFFVSPS